MALYNKTDSSSGDFEDNTEQGNFDSDGWITLSTSASITGNQDWWLQFVTDMDYSLSLYFDTTSREYTYTDIGWPPSWPSSLNSTGESNRLFSIYATYTPREEAEEPTPKQDVIFFD